MKKLKAFWWITVLIVSGCQSQTDVFPTDTWSEGCVELATNQGEYRLSGMCCAYAVFPLIDKAPKGSFKVSGRYYSFNGVEYASIPIEITGELTSKDPTLILSYTVGSQSKVHRLKPGRATMSCYCGCF
ncbi:hypothetical protein [Larkinella terrae]|uniref:Lipoprotein n=1 Tax=Larkinella terrae TaxID=2025311 RepID=A0A7K0EN12_9BACT|nr:hypothetical protein [Larkinella terrae]MRS62866.1 hypothetical protein [Larkinella terrae]